MREFWQEIKSFFQEKYKKYNNEEVLNEILKKGAENARVVASATLSRATKALGLN